MPYKDPVKRRQHANMRARIRRAALTPEQRSEFYRLKVKPRADLIRQKWAEERRARFRRWYHERGGKTIQAQRNGKPETLEYSRRKDLRRFGLTLEQYHAMAESQGSVCAICRKPENGRSLAVDHCHDSGKVRGLLCGKCNRAIGLFGEDISAMNRAIKYLIKNRLEVAA